MNILGIDTCEKHPLVELFIDNKIYKIVLSETESTSENLLIKIEEILNSNNVSLKNIDLLSVCTGPGSFTGVRIAISIIKGLASALSYIKLQEVNTFQKIAYKNNIKSSAIIIIPSGNKDVYYGVLDASSENSFSFKEYGFKQWSEILELAKNNNYKIYASEEDRLELSNFVSDEIFYVNNTNMSFCEIVSEKSKLEGFKSINNLAPLYIKQSQAERELKQLVKEKSELKRPIMVQDLLDIENECFNIDKFSKKTFLEELKEPTREYFVLYYKGKPIAYIGLMIVVDDLNLLKIAVLPEFRRLKLGTKLINKALEIKKERNLDKFFLEVNSNNTQAIKFYESLGFKILSERKNYYKNGDSCKVMFYEA